MNEFKSLVLGWALFALSLLLSLDSLDHLNYWLAFTLFSVILSLLIVFGRDDSAKSAFSEPKVIPSHRRYTRLLALIGLVVLFVFAGMMNLPIQKSDKIDVFLGVTSGMMAGVAASLSYEWWREYSQK